MSNIIQFPGKKGLPTPPTNSTSQSETEVNTPKKPKPKAQQKVLVGAVLAIALATLATNRIVYNSENKMELSSSGGRAIASVQSSGFVRDAQWEKSVAESLASADARGPASFNIGREVTPEEQLQLGTLQGLYSLQYSEDGHRLRGISLQGEESNPAYLSPERFFEKYGQLLDPRFKKALALKAPTQADGRVNESFQVIDMDDRPVLEAHFEMDRHGRLLSLQVTSPNHL